MWPSPYLDAFGEEVIFPYSVRGLHFDLFNKDINQEGMVYCFVLISAAVFLFNLLELAVYIRPKLLEFEGTSMRYCFDAEFLSCMTGP